MSMISCYECGKVYDTDFEMEVDQFGNCICNKCYEELLRDAEEFTDVFGYPDV
jgi:hypothetical protein